MQNSFGKIGQQSLQTRFIFRLFQISKKFIQNYQLLFLQQQGLFRQKFLLYHLSAATHKAFSAARQNRRMLGNKRQQTAYPGHLKHSSHGKPIRKAANQRRLRHIVAQNQPIPFKLAEVPHVQSRIMQPEI